MPSVKFAHATKSARYPSTTDSCPVCLSTTTLRTSARTAASIKNKPYKTTKRFKIFERSPRAPFLFCLDAMFTWNDHMTDGAFTEQGTNRKSSSTLVWAFFFYHAGFVISLIVICENQYLGQTFETVWVTRIFWSRSYPSYPTHCTICNCPYSALVRNALKRWIQIRSTNLDHHYSLQMVTLAYPSEEAIKVFSSENYSW